MLHQIPALKYLYVCKLITRKLQILCIDELVLNGYVECWNIKYVVCIYRLIKKCKQMINVGMSGVAWSETIQGSNKHACNYVWFHLGIILFYLWQFYNVHFRCV